MKKILLLIVMAAFIFNACSDTDTPKTTNDTDLMYILTSNNWYPDSAISGTSNVLLPCHMDDRHLFKSNGTYEINYGSTKCWSGQPASSNASTQVFSIDSDKKTMFFHNFGEDIECNIIQLDNNKLILEGHKSSDPNYYYYMSYNAI